MKVDREIAEVPHENLRHRLSAEKLPFSTTRDIMPLREIIGQERALKALRLGLDIESAGYNIFITGFAGTGRKTTIKSYLQKISRRSKDLSDLCYVNNFQNPDMPLLIKLPAGQGAAFKKDMGVVIETALKHIPQIFESEEYQSRRKKIVDQFQEQEKQLFQEYEKKVSSMKFAIVQIQHGSHTKPEIAPLLDGKAVPISQLAMMTKEGKVSEEDYTLLKASYDSLRSEMDTVFKKSRDLARQLREVISDVDADTVMPFITDMVNDLSVKYNNDHIDSYLEEVCSNILVNLNDFKAQEEEKDQLTTIFQAQQTGDPFLDYSINVIVDNSREKKVPIIIENYPTYKNLFGTIERIVDRNGYAISDFTRIKVGSFVRANGGYLVIDAVDALSESGVWPTLKRILKTGSLEIQNFDPFMVSSTALKPEPIPIDVKVVMIGDRQIYHMIYNNDEDFKKIFKIKADFDSSMDLNDESIQRYASFIRKIVDDEKLLHFSSDAVAEILEFGIRLSERQKKVSTKFSLIADLIRESSYWAKTAKSKIVERAHVQQTIDERRLRLNLVEEKLQEMIRDGVLMIDTQGRKIGQINGLAVYNYGDFMFGKPSRISAQVSVGKAGIINIEREAKLSGKIHDKGVLIIAGYFRGKYAREQALSISASICFEQSYSGIDGDSASAAEVFVLLSTLAEVPINQGIAVTGSVNQYGEIQPIGGVNEKIEGFFDVCVMQGLTGKQGVLIPWQNVEELMLRRDLVETITAKKFHVYPIKTIDEGIEVLTGWKAGEISRRNTYSRGTINYRVQQRLKKMAQRETSGSKKTVEKSRKSPRKKSE